MPEVGAGGQATPTADEIQARIDAEVAGLKRKNTELLDKLKLAQASMEPFSGLDAAKVKAALEAQDKAEGEAAKAAGDWDAREKALREQFAAEHTKVIEPLSVKAKQLEAELFEAVAIRDALEAMGAKETMATSKLALPVIREELDVVLVDGKRRTVVKGPDGKPRYHPTTNELFTVGDRLKELRAIPEYSGMFLGSGGSGGGAPHPSSSGTGVPTISRQDDKAFMANLDKIAKGEVKVT